MTINCNNLNFGLDCYVPSSLSEQNKLKSGKLVRELIDINKELEIKRNYMIISIFLHKRNRGNTIGFSDFHLVKKVYNFIECTKNYC